MEEGLDWLEMIARQFHLEDVDMRTYSPLTLAYIGDGVYELVVRTILVKMGNCPVNKLHRRASTLVRAGAQSDMIKALMPELSQEESKIYKRGQNAHSATMANNATAADYRRATGVETLMGWLYLTRQWERMLELIGTGLERTAKAPDVPLKR